MVIGMNKYGVILAGGGGTRFWPISRQELPKQFLNLTGSDLMVNETIDRLSEIVERKDIFIVTNEAQIPLMREAIQDRILPEHILSEPAARNTSACIGYAAMEILKKYGDGIMCILPSDHYIKDTKAYDLLMKKAVAAAEKTGKLVTIGIKPTFASTGYGYIQFKKGNSQDWYEVVDFVEKPDIRTAKAYVKSGNFLWNSGMFVWKASTILNYYKRLLPDIYRKLVKIGDAMNTEREQAVLQEVYPTIPKISIDYGIMERADQVVVLVGEFGWNDVGSWDALQALYEPDENGNIICGEQVHIDTRNCISYAQSRLIAALGVEDLIIVESDDAVLVCHKDKAQEVKHIVERLKEEGKERYL